MEVIRTLPARTHTFILAGGRGDRLFPLTADLPKPAVPFGGIFRIIDFALSNCLNSGLARIGLLTQYKQEPLHSYVGRTWGRRSQMVCLPPASGKRYRGTADAVFQNLITVEKSSEFILVLPGDHVYHMDYRKLLRQHAETGADLTIATVEHPIEDASRFGVVQVDDGFRVIGFQEKPQNPLPLPSNAGKVSVSMGIYAFRIDCLRHALIDDAERNHGRHDFARDVIPNLLGSAKVCAYDFRDPVQKIPAYWRDIGTVDAYYQASMDLVSPDPLFDPFHVQEWTTFVPETQIFDAGLARSKRFRLGACTGTGRVRASVLSPGVRIAKDAEVEEVILMRSARVGQGARIRRAIIEEDVEIPEGARIGFNLQQDREHYFVTETGITVVANHRPVITPRRSSLQWRLNRCDG